jgi:ferrous iron transport protein A
MVKAIGKDSRSVADMALGETGIIKQLRDHAGTIKLLEMGCIPGTEICMSFKAPLGGSICIEIGGYKLSLRAEEARLLSLVE